MTRLQGIQAPGTERLPGTSLRKRWEGGERGCSVVRNGESSHYDLMRILSAVDWAGKTGYGNKSSPELQRRLSAHQIVRFLYKGEDSCSPPEEVSFVDIENRVKALGVETDSQIPWEDLALGKWRCLNGHILRQAWWRMKVQVPDHKSIPFPGICHHWGNEIHVDRVYLQFCSVL